MINFSLLAVKKRVLGLSIKKKFMFSFLLIIVFTCLVIGGVSIFVSSRHLRNETLHISSQLAYQVLLNVDYRSAGFEKIAYHMVSDYKFQQVARSNLAPRSQTEEYLDASALGTIISGTTLSNPDILRMYVQMGNGTCFSWQKGNPKLNTGSLEKREKDRLDQLVELVRQNFSGVVWKRGEDGSIQFVRKIVDTENLSSLGYVVCEIEAGHFRLSLPSKGSLIDPANIVVLNRDDDTLVSAENPLIEPLVDYVLLQRGSGNDLNGLAFRYENDDYMMVQANAQYSKWKVFCFVPLKDIWREVNLITYSILLAGMMCLLSASLLAWFLSGGITRNIHLLQENMRKVETGDFHVRIRPVSYDELGKLALQFNYMVGKIRDLIQEVADERLMRQAKEYEVLQTQINPHFLYNTLGSIKCLAQLNGQQEIVKMTTYLVEILKAALNKNGEKWKFREELSFVDHYIDLQKIRYEDHFRVEYDIAEETEELYVVGFILQPLVENAIYHAFELEKPGGVIRIGSRVESGQLKIWVQDNGAGMDQETIARVMTTQQNKPYKGLNSIGVKNVDERIKYCFGEQYGLSFASSIRQGTTVEISLPVIREDAS